MNANRKLPFKNKAKIVAICAILLPLFPVVMICSKLQNNDWTIAPNWADSLAENLFNWALDKCTT